MNESRLSGSLSFMSWAAAEQPMPGEGCSGDISIVETVEDGALIAVADGLGHGNEAAKAAAVAKLTLRRYAGEPLEAVMKHCHDALRGTRGVALTLAQLNVAMNTLTWLGVGNVEGRLWAADSGASMLRQAPPLRGGVVGHALPNLRSSTIPIGRGDVIILNTDGVNNRFHQEILLTGTAQQLADNILKDHWMRRDDALVLVARYLGPM